MTTIRHSNQPSLASPIDIVGANSLLRINQNKCRVYMARAYLSVYYKLFYTSVILLSICVLVWVAMQFNTHPSQWWLAALDGVLSMALMGDVVWRATVQTPLVFFKDPKNWPDVFVCTLCLGMVPAAFVVPLEYQNFDELTMLSLFISRTMAQLLRLFIFLKNMQKSEGSVIELNDMSDGHSEEKPGILILGKEQEENSINRESINLNQDQSACSDVQIAK